MVANIPDTPDRDESQYNHTTEAQWDAAHALSPHGSPVLSPVDGNGTSKPLGPIQKRRRVTRACDGVLSKISELVAAY